MENLPSDIVLHISEYLEEKDHEQLSKTCVPFFWIMWDLSTCFWCDTEPQLSDYDMVFKDDFIPFCWYPHPNKCMGGCLGLPWHKMCMRCRDYEDSYYEDMYDEYAYLSLYWNDDFD